MHSFTEFLSEAFPPKNDKKKPPSPANEQTPGGNKPFEKKAQEPGDKAPFPPQNDGSEEVPGGGGSPFGQQDPDVEMQKMQMQAEKEQAELEARRAKEEEDAKERQRIKKMRLAADDEVAAALEDKFNDGDDTITFYPDMLSFSQFADDKKDKKKDGDDGKVNEEDADDDADSSDDDDESSDGESDDAEADGDVSDADDDSDEEADGSDSDEDLTDDEDEDSDDDSEQAVDDKKSVPKKGKNLPKKGTKKLKESFSGQKQRINRWMVKCPYCKNVFAIEGSVPPWNQTPEQLNAVADAHIKTCPKTEVRIRFRVKPHYQDRDEPEYKDVERRGRAVRDMLGTDWRIEQVTGTYNEDIRCGPKCRNSKGPQCDCSCGGKNHGAGYSIN